MGARRLSIVTVSYNDLDGLKRTFASIRCLLDSPEFEWIVSDGGSGKGVQEWLANGYATRWRSGPDKGIYDAMNLGAELATGTHLIFLNSGDEAIEDGYRALLARCRPTEILYGGFEMVMAGGRAIRRHPRSVSYLRYSLPTSHQAIAYPAPELLSLKYDSSFRIAGDYDLTCRMWRAGTAVLPIEECVARFYRGGTSTLRGAALAREAKTIQREVLKVPFLVREMHYVRRRTTSCLARLLDSLK